MLNGRVYAVVVEEVNIVKYEDHNDKEYLEISRGGFVDSTGGAYGYDDNLDMIKQGLEYMLEYDLIESGEQHENRCNYNGEPLQSIINEIYSNNSNDNK